MTTEEASGAIDWHNPIPGDTRLVRGEVDRLHSLRDWCRDSVIALRALDISAWHGKAAEAFGSVLRRQISQWSHAENAMTAAIDAVGDYLDTLVVLQPLAREAVHRARAVGSWQRAAEDILRWRDQAEMASQRTAGNVRVATDELMSIHCLMDDPAIVTATPRPAITPTISTAGHLQTRHETGGTTQRVVHETTAEQQSPADQLALTTALCNALLDARYFSAEQL